MLLGARALLGLRLLLLRLRPRLGVGWTLAMPRMLVPRLVGPLAIIAFATLRLPMAIAIAVPVAIAVATRTTVAAGRASAAAVFAMMVTRAGMSRALLAF